MGTTSQKLQYLTTTKSNIKDAINLTGANILSEDTFRSYADKLKQGLVGAINDGGSTIYSNFPKTTGEGTEITLNNTYAAPMGTTLKGNTEQDTLAGINLLAFPYYETTKTINDITFTVRNDGTIHVEGTASARAEFLIRNRDINLSITEGETYTLATSGLGVIDSTLWLDTYGQTGNFLDKWALTLTTSYTSAVAQAKDIKPLLRISVANGATVNTDVKVWLYKGAYDSSITYEPFVGGSPSPSPDYPQPVKVVTGNNTIVVSDGTNTDNYSLNLGSIELCKIGTYQDYIYKENNKWYKHSEIGKIVLDGSENWSDVQLASGYYRAYIIVSNILNLGNYRQTDIFCNNFNVTVTNGYSIIFHYGNQLYYYMPSDITTKPQFTTLLSQNNSIVYYPLSNPTNTEITDTDLIEQLEELEKAKSIENKTIISQTNANLPFIISASALSKN